MPYGQDAKLAIAFQNSRGTVANQDSMYLIPFLSESIIPQNPELLSNNMEGRFDEGEAYVGPRQVGGTVVSEAQPITLGVFITALMGAPASVQSDDIYTHTWNPRASDFSPHDVTNPLTVDKNMADGGQVLVHKDLCATRAEFSCRNSEFVQMAIDLMGGNPDSKVNSADLGTAVGKKWTWDVASVEIDGSANATMDEFNLIIDEQASPRWTLRTSQYPHRVKRDGRRQVRLNGAIQFEDQTEYDKFMANSAQALSITFTGPTEIQSGYYDVFQVAVPAFKYLTYPATFEDEAELIVRFEGKADYHQGSGTSVALIVTNTQAAYI